MACYVYRKRVADTHLWPKRTRKFRPYEHGCGPCCERCGVSLGTIQWEEADERHFERTGHHLNSGHCVEAHDLDMTKPWWEIEPMNSAEPEEGARDD